MNNDNREFVFTKVQGGAALGVRVVTRTTETELVGKTEDGAIRVRLTATNAGGTEANTELVEFLARQLNVDTRAIEIVAGADSRDKILSIMGLTSEEVETRLKL